MAWFGWRSWQQARTGADGRARLLSQAGEVLDDTAETLLASGYSKVTGTYGGLPVVLEPVVDTLNIRKLPALWLMVTLPTPMPVRATFDLMMRATGLEVFSRYHTLEHAITPPADFPEWAGVRSDDPTGVPPAEVVARHLGRFHQGTGKELLITPKGMRMVVLLDEADRGGYLIMRAARFGAEPVEAAVLRSILDDLVALKSDLAAASTAAARRA